MVKISDIANYANDYLAVEQFEDYCPNGLQVECQRSVHRLVSGVTACQALIEAAVEHKADALLVHHGYFWRGEHAAVVGMKAKRLATLLNNDIGLLTYHLPLDAHPVVGNNVQIAKRLKISLQGSFGDKHRVPLARYGTLATPCSAQDLALEIEHALLRPPLLIAGGPVKISSVGVCTGAAQSYIEDAVALGLDAFISGEISENTVHTAREEKIHYYAAGHHATERYGVQALGEHLAEHFKLDHQFIEIENPV